MKLDKLIEQALKLQKRGYGDLEVRVYADHGQCSMAADNIYLGWIEQDEYMAEGIHPDDLEEYPDAIKIIEIS